jgi:hypothetical protein
MQQVAAAPTQQIGACRVRSKWSAEALPSYIPQPRATSYPKAQPLGAVVDRQDNDAADLWREVRQCLGDHSDLNHRVTRREH